MKLYRNFLMAGVVALGLSACGDDLTITDAPPPATTENIQSFSVSPTSATIAPGNFVQASATLVTAEGVTGSVAWSSSNPAVATVDANGRIDAVAEGTSVVTATATAGGQTATAAVGVTVRPIEPAQISIQSVTTGATDTPVNISNVAGQIEINMNFNPGEELVDSIAVFIGSKRAAKQVYVTSPSAGPVSLSVNTANYVKNVDAGTATVDFPNGATTISAAVYPRGGAATATNTIQIVLNNADGWAADLTKPSRSANDVDGVTFWGGPGEEGVATATLYPVIYTPGRTITQVSYRVGHIGYAGCPTVTQTELPFRASFGYGDVADQDCTGYEWPDGGFGGQRDNVVFMGALDNQSTPFPSYMSLISNSVVLGSTPDSARFDWEAPEVDTPSITRTLPAVTGWVNASFSFVNFSSDDDGVGLKATRDRKTFYNAPNCGGAEDVAMATGTGADIPECATNAIGGAPGITNSSAPYAVYGTESDRLGNVGMSDLTDTFGVDKTVPSIRWGLADATLALDSALSADTIFTTLPAGEAWRVEFLDLGVAPAGFSASAQTQALSVANHEYNIGHCIIGTGSIGSAFVTAPACTMATAGASATRTDGWQAGETVPVPVSQGYFGYASKVVDAAGNASPTMFRKALVNSMSPVMSVIGMGLDQLTDSVMNFQAAFADSVEVAGYALGMQYPAFANLAGSGSSDSVTYPIHNVGTLFDDEITSPYSDIVTPSTPLPYVRHAEAVTATAFPGSNVAAAPTGVKPSSVSALVWNFGGIEGAGAPMPAGTNVLAIPAFQVQDGVDFEDWNVANPDNQVTHFRVIPDIAPTNYFGSEVPLRAQLASNSNDPNPAFVRVDFYRYDATAQVWKYLGSSSSAVYSDQGSYRSYVWSLADDAFVTDRNGADQTELTNGDIIAAVGVTSAGDGLVAGAVMP